MTGSFDFYVFVVWTETIFLCELRSRRSNVSLGNQEPVTIYNIFLVVLGLVFHGLRNIHLLFYNAIDWILKSHVFLGFGRRQTFSVFLEAIQSRTTRLSVQKCVSCVLSAVSFWTVLSSLIPIIAASRSNFGTLNAFRGVTLLLLIVKLLEDDFLVLLSKLRR